MAWMRTSGLLAALVLASPAGLAAQTAEGLPDAQGSPANVCAQDDGFDDFDFWIGSWRVVGHDKAQTVFGRNRIEKIQKGCALRETWRGKEGSSGTSLNFYDPVAAQWRQVWVAPPGYAIDIAGGLDADGAMALTGTITYYARGETLPFRGTWTPLEAGAVRQHFEQYDAAAESWNTWFDGLYLPADAEASE